MPDPTLTSFVGLAGLQWLVTKPLDLATDGLRKKLRRKLRPGKFARAAEAAMRQHEALRSLEADVRVDPQKLKPAEVLEALVDAAVHGEEEDFAARLLPAVTTPGLSLGEEDRRRLLTYGAGAVVAAWLSLVADDAELFQSVVLVGQQHQADVGRWLVDELQRANRLLDALGVEVAKTQDLIRDDGKLTRDAVETVKEDTEAARAGIAGIDEKLTDLSRSLSVTEAAADHFRAELRQVADAAGKKCLSLV